MKTNGVAYIALVSLISIASCAKDANQSEFHEFADSELTLDCALGFDQLVADAIAMEGMELITETGEQQAYMAGPVSYTVTKDGHHAHPMIIRRDISSNEDGGVAIKTAACGYAEQEGFDNAVTRFTNLNRQFEFKNNIDVKISGDNIQPTIGTPSDLTPEQPPVTDDDEELSIEIEPADDVAEQPEEE